MTQKWLPASSLIGGEEGALDAIDGSELSDGDRAVVIADRVYFYILNGDSYAPETPPYIISPDSNAGDKRWIMAAIYPDSFDPNTGKIIIALTSNTVENTVLRGGVVGGKNNTLSGSVLSCLVLGGDTNTIADTCENCMIAGGEKNEISQTIENSVIFGGNGNVMKNYAHSCGMIGGWDLALGQDCDCSVFVGGWFNSIAFGSDDCAVVGGYSNQIINDSGESIILGGDSCSISGCVNAVISCGYKSRVALSNMAMVIGSNIAAGQADNIIASGDSALANIQGQKSFADGKFSVVGDAQISDFVLIVETIDGVQAELPVNDTYGGIPIMTAKTCRFDISVVARQTAGTAGTVGDSAICKISGGIKNVGATLSQGTVSFSSVASDGDIITLNGVVYTFKDTPDYTFSQVLVAGSAAEQASNFLHAVRGHFGVMDVELDGTDVIITAYPNYGTAANSWDFTTTGANISCDGPGRFGGTSAFAAGTVSIVGTPQGTGTPGANDHDAAVAAQGTITMSGLPVADETFVVDTQTFTWKASRSTTGEVTIGADAAECVTNIVTAVGLDLTTVTAEDGAGDTVVLTAATAGSAGNSIVLTESATNMAVDGSGSLGATTEGDDKASLWEVDVKADNTDKALKINVTGEADKTIHWVAKVQLVEVG